MNQEIRVGNYFEIDKGAWQKAGKNKPEFFSTGKHYFGGVTKEQCEYAYKLVRLYLGKGVDNKTEVIKKAQAILAEYIVPDSGISDHECINRLLGLLDGPEAREALK